jgi:riboflavin kinase / FMN adenylyltransferase
VSAASERRTPAAAVAIGVFDGLHLGHQALLGRARRRAERDSIAVISFDPHPDLVLAKDFHPQAPLTPIPEKRARLQAMGIDVLEVLPFTRELAALEPEEFVARHVVQPFAPRVLVVGEGFALGRGRSGNVPRLAAIGERSGFTVEAVPVVTLDGAPVSSTRIREQLAHGDVAAAARCLGRLYDLSGTVVHGDAIGRTLGWPTANVRMHDEKLLPRLGIYAAWVRIEGEAARRAGALSIGTRPTVGGRATTIEVHLLDYSADLVGRTLVLELVEWLRPEAHFANLDELRRAIADDVERVRSLLVSGTRPPGRAATLPGRA